MGKLAEYVREANAPIAHLALGLNSIGDEAMIHLLEAVKDAWSISLDISCTGCGDPSASKLIEILATTEKNVAFVEDRAAKRRMSNKGAVLEIFSDDAAMRACTPFRMCIEAIDLRNNRSMQSGQNETILRNNLGRPVAKKVEKAASEVSCARLRMYQVLAFSEVLVDRLGENSSLQILSHDLCIHVAQKVFETQHHERLCAALSSNGQTWFSARVLI